MYLKKLFEIKIGMLYWYS